MARSGKPLSLVVVAAVVAALVAAGALALLVNIFERKSEARNPFYRVVELTDDTVDPATWGSNFPQQYDGYRRTVDQVRTRYGGSEAVPRTPTQADPRSVVAQSKLEEDPRLKTATPRGRRCAPSSAASASATSTCATAPWTPAGFPAQGPVLPRLRGGRELHGLSRAAGGGACAR